MSVDKEGEFITGLLELYREHECIWRVRFKDYSNKLKRIRAHWELLELSRKYIQDVNINWVEFFFYRI